MRLTRWASDHGPDSVRSRPFRYSRSGRHGAAPHASTSLLGEEQTSGRGQGVEVKIGVTDSPRERSVHSAQTPSEVEKLITDALGSNSGVLALTDDKGRRFLVQAARIAYVEIGAADVRRVGFGVGAVGSEAVKSG